MADLFDVVVARKLSGGGGGAELLIVNVSNSLPPTLDRTWQEIHDALTNGIPAYLKVTDSDFSITLTPIWGTDLNVENNLYNVYTSVWGGDAFYRISYSTSTSDGYPRGRS